MRSEESEVVCTPHPLTSSSRHLPVVLQCLLTMRPFRLRTDLTRGTAGDFALPLGVEPGVLPAPTQGYTLKFNPASDEGPDTYSFDVVVSHEKLQSLLHAAFDALLPDEVFGIVEVGSRDAYRSTDVFISAEPIPKSEFIETWNAYEPVLLEDGTIGAGANSDEPYVEVFIDHFKGLFIQVPVELRDKAEDLLHRAGLQEVAETWPATVQDLPLDVAMVRPVVATDGADHDVMDELLFELRQLWALDLNIDVERNIDDSGRNLGLTLWYAEAILEHSDDPNLMTHATIWATAGSLAQLAKLVEQAIARCGPWRFVDFYTVDRVAHDERPEELVDLPPRRKRAEIHLLQVDPPTPADRAKERSSPEFPDATDSAEGEAS